MILIDPELAAEATDVVPVAPLDDLLARGPR